MAGKDVEPQTGAAGVDRALAAGKNPNADIEGPIDNPTRAQAAITLWLAGMSFANIAERLKYASATAARSAIEHRLADASDSPESREMARVKANKRVERLIMSHWGKAIDHNDPNQLAYSARVLTFLERQAKLLGLDAPTQSVVYTPTMDAVQEFLTQFKSVVDKDREAEEADIWDAEIEEDDAQGEP